MAIKTFAAFLLAAVAQAANTHNYCIGGTSSDRAFTRDQGLQAIDAFCADTSVNELTIDGLSFFVGYNWPGASDLPDDCKGYRESAVSTEECAEFLQSTIDNCDTDTVTVKHGGSIIAVDDAGLCEQYNIWVQVAPAPTPSSAA